MDWSNQEEIKQYHKAYYKANCEKIKAQTKAWREANPVYDKSYRKAHHEINRERDNNQSKLWAKVNPNKNREASRKRRALKHTTQVEPINDKIVYLRDGWICQICKKRVDKRLKWPDPMSPSVDHIMPLYEGGSHTYKNVQLAHLGCNLSKKTDVLPQGEQLRIF